MDDIARLGDLLTLADRQLRAAALTPETGPGSPVIAAQITQAADVARALARYLDDVLAGDQLEIVLNRDAGSRSHTAAHVRYALQMADTSFRAAATVATAAAGPVAEPSGGGLADVATSLSAGRDLLRTHFTTDETGFRTPASGWAAVIGSEAFAGALLGYLGRQARHLAAWTARTCYLTTDHAAISDNVRVELASAQQWLTLAGTAAQASARQHPVTAAEKTLLAAVPANVMPAPRPLSGAEPFPVLCEGIIAVAERLRLTARWRPALAARSPLATAESWRWLAAATAVASDMSQVILTALAGRDHGQARPPGTWQHPLASAAQSAAGACASWRQAAAAWKYMTTDTRGLRAPGLADTGDLVVRLGRLAYADPLWTPGRSRHAAVRPASDLAANDPRAAIVLAAVHHAADALELTAAADHHAVEQAVAADRLYVPSRTLPESFYGQRYPFGLALGEDTQALCDAYAVAAEASARMAASLDVAAVITGAPSTVLAIARAAARVPLAADEQAPVLLRAGERAEGAASRNLVEAVLRRSGMNDPMLLLRAKLIDEAGRQLVTEAEGTAAVGGQRDGAIVAAKSEAVVTAGHNFPHLVGTARGMRQPGSRSTVSPAQVADQPGPRRKL